MPRLTHVAHERLAQTIRPGDYVIDATAGNGHDTRFLARLIGAHGHVLAIDLQPSALETTRQRLAESNMAERVILKEGDHANLISLAPPEWLGAVSAVTFNLGYLPGSDKSVITTADSTRAALDASLRLLKRGGLLSLLIYRGHAGGHDEEAMILDWLNEASGEFSDIEWFDGDFPTKDSPRLLIGAKL